MVTQKAGCILINMNTQEIALVCRKGELSFPKGHLEEGETLQQCAIRETIEETGHACHIYKEEIISKINYVTPKGENVECYFYIAIDDGIYKGTINNEDKEESIWKKVEEIEASLSYENLKEFWNTVKGEIKKIIGNEYV